MDDGKLDVEKLKQMEESGNVEVLKRAQANRKVGQQNLDRAVNSLQNTLEKIRENLPGEPLMVLKDEKGDTAFSLEGSLRDLTTGLDSCLMSIESMNSIVDMIIHDLGGTVYNLDQTQRAMLVANSHVQNLIELLKEKGLVSESELEASWNKLVAAQKPTQ